MNTTPSATRHPKQARAIRTRERILDQSEHAFAAEGFENASLTSDILDPSGISVGSFYHQFADKRAVLHALLDERGTWRGIVEHFRAATEDHPSLDAAIRSGVLALFDAIDEHPDPWWIHFREVHSADTEIRALIEQSWATWIDSVEVVVHRWADDTTAATNTAAATSSARTSFASSGLAGVLRSYLVADDATRSEMRSELVDDVVAAFVASLAG